MFKYDTDRGKKFLTVGNFFHVSVRLPHVSMSLLSPYLLPRHGAVVVVGDEGCIGESRKLLCLC